MLLRGKQIAGTYTVTRFKDMDPRANKQEKEASSSSFSGSIFYFFSLMFKFFFFEKNSPS